MDSVDMTAKHQKVLFLTDSHHGILGSILG